MNNNRTDLELITSLVDEGTRILDVGCGNGELLQSLKDKKNVRGQGLELKQERVNQCVSRGLSAIQGNADSDLSLYPNQSFDCVILSQTIQATSNPKNILIELVRIGKKAIVSIPNFGFWKVRAGFATYGKMPITKKLSNNYDPLDKGLAVQSLNEAEKNGKVLTGLLYINPEVKDHTEILNIADTPFNQFSDQELCPGSDKLERVNESLN